MDFPSSMAPDPSDPLVFASIHLLLHNKQQQKERLFRSLGLHDILLLSPSSTRLDRRCHRKHRSRKSNSSKMPLHYLKPGALAQMRDAQRSAARTAPYSDCCASKRVLDECNRSDMVLDSGHIDVNESGRGDRVGLQPQQAQTAAMTTSETSPGPATRVFVSNRVLGPFCPQRKKLLAPRTPLPLPLAALITPAIALSPITDSSNESHLESLPLELLVRIVCNLHHDQLKPAFHVSKRFRQAVLIARQWHFDFTTPERERQDALRLTTDGENVKLPVLGAHVVGLSRPTTPRAPRQAQKPLQARVPLVDLQKLAGPLFHGHENPPRRVKPLSLPRPANRAVASHRVLFYEEQLCQAVAQNSI